MIGATYFRERYRPKSWQQIHDLICRDDPAHLEHLLATRLRMSSGVRSWNERAAARDELGRAAAEFGCERPDLLCVLMLIARGTWGRDGSRPQSEILSIGG